MIGFRCLGPGGSAARASTARIRSTADAAQRIAPFAECSYRLWRPPSQEQASAAAPPPQCSRCFSTVAPVNRAHTGSPHVSISVDQHGIESIFHDPPSARPKAKRLRPVSALPSDSATSDVDAKAQQSHPPLSHAASRPNLHLKDAPVHVPARLPPTPPPDHPVSTRTKYLAARPYSTLSSQLLLDYLTTSDSDIYERVKSQLPSGFRRIDAYLLLRERDPQRLSALSFRDIRYLVSKVGYDNLGGVLVLLLEDIIGTGPSTPGAKPGYFQIRPGTEERYKLLREILVRSNRSNLNDFLLHDGAALNVFMLMLDDLVQLRQSAKGEDANPSLSLPSSITEETSLHIPTNFPVGETRRLIKLAIHLHRPELAPIINALRTHLEAHTPDFPSAREGSQLIAYYLQPNVRDFAAALDVVRALRDTNALPQEVVDDAVQDGKTYLASLEGTFASLPDETQSRPSEEELQQICMDVTLRIIAMKSLMAHRPKGGVQYRKAFESLVASFRLDLIDTYQGSGRHDLGSLLNVPMRSIRAVFLHLVGYNEASCLTEALFVLQRTDQRLVALLPNTDLQAFCDAAKTTNSSSLITESFAYFVKAKTSSASTLGLPPDAKHFLARDGFMVDADTFLGIMRSLISNGQKVTIAALIRALHVLPMNDASVAQLNLRFSAGQRSRLIALLASAGLVDEAFLLFQYWSYRRYEAGSELSPSAFKAVSLRDAFIRVDDPLIERQIRLMHDVDRQVATSAECLVALVRSICRHPSAMIPRRASAASSHEDALHVAQTLPDQLEKARFVINVFKEACTSVDWTHYRLNALAQACFVAKDVVGAFDAFAKFSFLREIPDHVDIDVLMGGLVELDADKTVDLFIRHCTAPLTLPEKERAGKGHAQEHSGDGMNKSPTLAPMRPTPRLTSTLISRALAQNRMDLVDRLYRFSESIGIASRLGYESSTRSLFSDDLPPGKVRGLVHRMVEAGSIPQGVLLENLARRLVRRAVPPSLDVTNHRGLGRKGHGTTGKVMIPPAKDRLLLFQSACYLMRVSARQQDAVNLFTVSEALDAVLRESQRSGGLTAVLPNTSNGDMASKAILPPARSNRQRSKEERRLQWIAAIDSIVHLLRWTKFFDKGDDMRLGMPLWKSSGVGNGQLVSSEIDDLLDLGFVGSRNQRSRAQTTAAAAATMPMSAESASTEVADGTDKDIDASETVDTDGVIQRFAQRSPNVLPADLFCRLTETYLALGDVSGAAEVASWMRDEAKIDLGRLGEDTAHFVSRIKAAVLECGHKQSAAEGGITHDSKGTEGSRILRMLAGQQNTERTKRWWSP
ncbi:hypothetical protein PHSY_004749 [Pseudozyma hubeiensis SY62]|uniref:Uncharacterized protein n=1 Tax=Pseudozyma hubeiensis (strain SY62) TaxID=1305764 RepID=R9P746_PSEHS|nr:hypothetical protein PHSY_004749 [Pseudozyma hubeiensis SY62]GAC97164.1 hypothetical protein PHSY_004749 [Pseudozyma hubeiensis SY62]